MYIVRISFGLAESTATAARQCNGSLCLLSGKRFIPSKRLMMRPAPQTGERRRFERATHSLSGKRLCERGRSNKINKLSPIQLSLSFSFLVPLSRCEARPDARRPQKQYLAHRSRAGRIHSILGRSHERFNGAAAANNQRRAYSSGAHKKRLPLAGIRLCFCRACARRPLR